MVEGYARQWILLDYFDFVIHVFSSTPGLRTRSPLGGRRRTEFGRCQHPSRAFPATCAARRDPLGGPCARPAGAPSVTPRRRSLNGGPRGRSRSALRSANTRPAPRDHPRAEMRASAMIAGPAMRMQRRPVARCRRRCSRPASPSANAHADSIKPTIRPARLPVQRLLRRVATRSQIELPAEQRQLNVRDAFGFSGKVADVVVLVDDVTTTGATLNACARVLKAGGVREVRALTAARVSTARR